MDHTLKISVAKKPASGGIVKLPQYLREGAFPIDAIQRFITR